MRAMTDLERLARLAGIFDAFKDMAGVTHETTDDTRRALLRANGFAVGSAAEVRDSLALLEAETENAYAPSTIVLEMRSAATVPVSRPGEWQVIAESDDVCLAEGRAETEIALPPLPDGVHRLRMDGPHGAQETTLIVAPPHAPSLADATGRESIWGVVGALYGLHDDPGQSLGDYSDLANLARGLGAVGAGFLGINPVHALGVAARGISPYSPTHRGFLNTDHIALDGLNDLSDPPGLLDYAAHRQAQRPTLEARFAAHGNTAERAAFDTFCLAGGQVLERFATFEALSETHGPDSRAWPANPVTTPDRVRFHKWLQWLADRQLGKAQEDARGSGMALGLYLDLAVGATIGGAESWGEDAATATGVSLGAPPDHLSPAGQNWQLTALSPRKLQAQRFEAFRFVLRQNMRHCGLLRIDHALGLNRSFWLPEDGTPGGYIRQPFDVLMALIALEAHRAGTVIVGEDLGLVPPGFRDEMEQRGLYGYSVLQYEKDARGDFLPARALRPQSLACFGTHDTPTLAGFWAGRDIAWWERLGWIKPDEAARATDRRNREKRQLAGLPAPKALPGRAGTGVRDAVHQALAGSPSELVAVQLDDILCLEDAQNLPGTVDEHPNWRRRYPQDVDTIVRGKDLQKTAEIMAQAGRAAALRKETP